MEASSFDSNSLIRNIDQFIEDIPDLQNKAEEGEMLLKIASEALNSLNESINEVKRPLSEREVQTLATVLYKLNRCQKELVSKRGLFKEKMNEFNNIGKQYTSTINNALKLIFNDKSISGIDLKEEDVPLASLIFKLTLISIRSDAHEEVIGQERNPGAIPKMLTNQIFPGGTTRTETPQRVSRRRAVAPPQNPMLNKINEIAGVLYPLVLLSAHLDPRAPVPTESKEAESLEHDKEQFRREYQSQFGKVKGWSKEFFGKCLQAIWQERRSHQ